MSLILKGTTHSFTNCLPLEMYQNTMLYVDYCAVCLCVYVYVKVYLLLPTSLCRSLCLSPFLSILIFMKERNVLFNDALNTFYLRLYGVRHMVKDHSDSEKGNPLPPHRLLLSINSKGSFICTIPQTG